MKAYTPAPRNGEPFAQKETVAYAELLKLAHEEGLKSITTELLLQPSEENGRHCIVKATVESDRGHYEGLGDADPGNVESFLLPHLIRVAETRAKARALRDAVNVGVVSLEELDGVGPNRTTSPGSGADPPPNQPSKPAAPPARPRTSTPPRPTKAGNGSPPPNQPPKPAPPPARPRTSTPPRPTKAGNGSPEPMTEGQRRYLFRLMSGQGYQREAAENRLKEIFEVSALSEITKTAAIKMIDELLQISAPGNGEIGR